MTYQPRKPSKIQSLWGFKPMTNYSTGFEISKEKAYEILKARANGMQKHKAYIILALMGFKPTTSNKFLFHQIPKRKP